MKTVAAVFTACGDSITNRIMEYDILMTGFCRTAPPPLKFKRYNLALLSSRYIFTFCEAIFGKPWIIGNHRALPGSLRNSEE